MHKMIIITALLVVGFVQTVATAPSSAADRRNTEGDKGVTVDGLGRGVKSAAQNIEKEIPKMGSAIGAALKKITEQGSGKQPSQQAAGQKQ